MRAVRWHSRGDSALPGLAAERLAREAVGRALEKVAKENGVRDALVAGSTLRGAYDRFGVL